MIEIPDIRNRRGRWWYFIEGMKSRRMTADQGDEFCYGQRDGLRTQHRTMPTVGAGIIPCGIAARQRAA